MITLIVEFLYLRSNGKTNFGGLLTFPRQNLYQFGRFFGNISTTLSHIDICKSGPTHLKCHVVIIKIPFKVLPTESLTF